MMLLDDFKIFQAPKIVAWSIPEAKGKKYSTQFSMVKRLGPPLEVILLGDLEVGFQGIFQLRLGKDTKRS